MTPPLHRVLFFCPKKKMLYSQTTVTCTGELYYCQLGTSCQLPETAAVDWSVKIFADNQNSTENRPKAS